MCPIREPTPPPTTTTTLGVRSFVCNLTDSVICPSAMCAVGNQYLTTLYSVSSSIAPGAQLYYDEALTQPAINQTWVRWTNNDTIYALSSEGVVQSEGLLTCPI